MIVGVVKLPQRTRKKLEVGDVAKLPFDSAHYHWNGSAPPPHCWSNAFNSNNSSTRIVSPHWHPPDHKPLVHLQLQLYGNSSSRSKFNYYSSGNNSSRNLHYISRLRDPSLRKQGYVLNCSIQSLSHKHLFYYELFVYTKSKTRCKISLLEKGRAIPYEMKGSSDAPVHITSIEVIFTSRILSRCKQVPVQL